jgi:hypothetical protein
MSDNEGASFTSEVIGDLEFDDDIILVEGDLELDSDL